MALLPRIVHVLSLVTVVALAHGVVHAQADTDAEAHALFDAGEIAYNEGRWDSALEYFQRAYELSHRAPLLYNVGSAAEHARHDAVALDAFRSYLAAVPDAPHRPAVEARIAVLEQAIAQAGASEPSEPTEPAPATAGSPGADPAPWITLGVGAAVAVAGAVVLGVGFADIATVQNAADGTSLSAIRDAHDQAPVLTGVGWAAIGVGVALAAAGLIWGLSTGPATEPRAAAWIDGQSGGVVVGGAF